jgi:ribosome maturation factor RimP
MLESQIEEIVLRKLNEPDFTDCFLMELNLSGKKKLEIIIDADGGVTFEKCQKISRYVENWLDTEGVMGDDYTIEVSSPGASRPLKLKRQYPKHIGRPLEMLTTEGGNITGILKQVNDTDIVLEVENIRKEGKKKIKETLSKTIPFDTIKTATVKIVF